MSLLSFIKDWWLEVFHPKRFSETSRSLLNFDIERSMAIMGVSTLNQMKSLRYYKIYDLIIHFIHWIKYMTLYIISSSHYWVALGDFTINFGQYRHWALNLYFFSYTAISGVWYRFEFFPATEQYYSWLTVYNQSVSSKEAKKPEWIKLKRRVNLVWTLLQYSLIYGTALPHFALLVTPSIYATNSWQMIISLIFCLIAMQRLLFLCKAIENILFLFITFMMILDYKLKIWRSLNEGQFNETGWVNYLRDFMSINHTYQSGNRILSRIGGLFYAQTFITVIINMYIVFFITVPFGVKIMTIVSLTVALSIVILPPFFCRSANQSNKLVQKVLMEAAFMDGGSISLRLKAQSMIEFNKRYPIGITFFDVTQFDTKLFINTMLEMSSYMFLLVIQTRRQGSNNVVKQ